MKTSEMIVMVAAGVGFLLAGLAIARRLIAAAAGWEKLIVCGPALVASALAVFGVEHFIAAHAIAAIVPVWLPWRIFWVYFFGVALIAAAVSFVIRRAMGTAAWGLAAMFFLFVATISLPALVAHPANRISWMLTLRDSSFGASCLAYAGWLRGRRWAAEAGRIFFALAAGVFGVEHLIYWRNAPGVPLEKLTPAWVPVPAVWAWIVGAVLVVGATCILAERWPRVAGAVIGLAMALVTVALYVPIFLMASRAGWLEGLNYIFDTLLYAGAALLVAASVGRSRITA